MVIGGGRVLELGVPKIYVGSSKCAKHTQLSMRILGGSGGMSPQKNFEN